VLKGTLAIGEFGEDLRLTIMREKASKRVLTTGRRESAELVGANLGHRYADTVVSAEVRGGDGQRAAVHFEFQDRNDRTMPERMMRYEYYIRWAPRPRPAGGPDEPADSAGKPAGDASKPPLLGGVLSVVLYTGRAPWTASQYLERESADEPWPEQQPRKRYELVDLTRSPCDDLDGTSVWAVVQKLLRAEPEEVPGLWRELMRRAAAKAGEEGCLAAGALVEELLRPLGMAKEVRAANEAAAKGDGEMPEGAMLEAEDRVTAWRRKLLEEGRTLGAQEGERRGRKKGVKEGERRGRKKGVKEGERRGLLRIAELKFGPEAAEGLAGVATPDQGPNGLSLARLGEWIIDCETLEELLARLENEAE